MFRLSLIPEWRFVLTHAWSLHWVAASAFFILADLFFSTTQWFELPLPHSLYLVLAAFCSLAAFISRILAQQEIQDALSEARSQTQR